MSLQKKLQLLKGVELEHASDNVPANEEPDNIDDKDDKNEQNEQYSQPSATEDNRFDDSTHSVNDTFTDLKTNEAKILARTKTRPSTLNSLIKL